MRHLLILIACICVSILGMQAASGFQNVGEDFGRSWLVQHGAKSSQAAEKPDGLWSWGMAPKGFEVINGVLYPPGYAPMWYYPDSPIDSTPIIINNTARNNAQYTSPYNQMQGFANSDPWLLSQLTGRPVAIIPTLRGPLF